MSKSFKTLNFAVRILMYALVEDSFKETKTYRLLLTIAETADGEGS